MSLSVRTQTLNFKFHSSVVYLHMVIYAPTSECQRGHVVDFVNGH